MFPSPLALTGSLELQLKWLNKQKEKKYTWSNLTVIKSKFACSPSWFRLSEFFLLALYIDLVIGKVVSILSAKALKPHSQGTAQNTKP